MLEELRFSIHVFFVLVLVALNPRLFDVTLVPDHILQRRDLLVKRSLGQLDLLFKAHHFGLY